MGSNKELLKKADLAVADLTSDGGLLNPEQANTFIRKLLIQPTLLSQVRRVVMNAPERKVNKIQFANRIMKAATTTGDFEARRLSAGDRSKPTTEQITLVTKEVIAEVHLPYDVIEDNIERGNLGLTTDVGGQALGGGIKDTIMTLIAERAALDLEEFALFGDTSSGDPYLALTDGYLKRATTNVVDVGGAPISRKVLTNGIKTMPVQYRRNRAGLRHYLATEQEIDYRETVAQRETGTGDAQTKSLDTIYAAGAPVEGVGLMPNDQGLLTNPLNLLFGIQRQIMVETDKDIRGRAYIIVLTARVDFQIEEEEAVVKYINFGTT